MRDSWRWRSSSTAKLLALVLPLGLDAVAVARPLPLGMAGLPQRHRVRISLLFTTFEGGMPITGDGIAATPSFLIGKAGGALRQFEPSALALAPFAGAQPTAGSFAMTDTTLRPASEALVLAGIGIAGYPTYVHYAGLQPICGISHGCETLQTSRYASLLGLPVALGASVVGRAESRELVARAGGDRDV